MTQQFRSSLFFRSPPHGFVLVMSLVFLLLLTIIGITGLTTSSLEEKMAGNAKDKNLSLQAAESARAMVQTWLDDAAQINNVEPAAVSARFNPGSSSTDGFYKASDFTLAPLWTTFNWNTSSSGEYLDYPNVPWGTTASLPLNSSLFASQPRYMIEWANTINCSHMLMGSAGSDQPMQCNVMRVTTRGAGGTNVAVSMTQMSYSKKFK